MKKYISKLYVLLVFAVFVMMAVSCGKADTTNKITDIIEDSKDIADEEEKEAPVSTAPTQKAEPTEKIVPTEKAEPTKSVEPTENPEPLEEIEPLESVEPIVITDLEIIDETVLFDRDGIRVTAKEFVYDLMWQKEINLLIENDTDKNIGMMINTLVVNNYMIDDFFSCGVAPRTTVNEMFPLSSVSTSVIGINVISEVAISFHVFDNDSGDTLFVSDEVAIPTSEYGAASQPAMEDGKELWNQAGVRILGKYVDENSPWGTAVLVYIENTSEEDVLIQCDDLSINGSTAIPFFFCQVNKGRRALDSISIMNYLEDNNIQEVKDIGLIFSLVDPTNNLITDQSEVIQLMVGE